MNGTTLLAKSESHLNLGLEHSDVETHKSPPALSPEENDRLNVQISPAGSTYYVTAVSG